MSVKNKIRAYNNKRKDLNENPISIAFPIERNSGMNSRIEPAAARYVGGPEQESQRPRRVKTRMERYGDKSIVVSDSHLARHVRARAKACRGLLGQSSSPSNIWEAQQCQGWLPSQSSILWSACEPNRSALLLYRAADGLGCGCLRCDDIERYRNGKHSFVEAATRKATDPLNRRGLAGSLDMSQDQLKSGSVCLPRYVDSF
jgi:hypothetical protein